MTRGVSLKKVHALSSSNHFILIALIKTDNLGLIRTALAGIYPNHNPNVHQSATENSSQHVLSLMFE